MFCSSILNNLPLFLQIPTQIQSHSKYFGNITPEFGKFHWKVIFSIILENFYLSLNFFTQVPFVTNSMSYWVDRVTERYLLVGEIQNEDPKVECEPSKPNDKEVATGNLENLKRKKKVSFGQIENLKNLIFRLRLWPQLTNVRSRCSKLIIYTLKSKQNKRPRPS